MTFCTRLIVPRSCRGLCIQIHSKTGPFTPFMPPYLNFRSRDSSILPEELATQSVRLKEEQLRREEEKVCLRCCLFCAKVFNRWIFAKASRDRAQGAARDQREETGTARKRRIAQVRGRLGNYDLIITRSDIGFQESREPTCCSGIAGRIPRLMIPTYQRCRKLFWNHVYPSSYPLFPL
jgi:hypothetical protein